MTFTRTEDMELVRLILTEKTVWPHLVDDFHPPRETFEPCMHPEIWYVLAEEGDDLVGMWMFVPENAICWEAHTCLLPGHGYRRARRAARELAEWIWANTPCRRLVAKIPGYNYWALRFARDVGFKQWGRNENSYQKGGKIWDQICLGLSRPETPPADELKLAA